MKQNYLLTLIMCLLLSSSLWAQDARKLVADFDQKGSVKAANCFFDYLDQEQFTDERIQFATNTPTDSLRKEVWYWAGEWFNDTQEYGLARQYALRALPLYRHDNAAKGEVSVSAVASKLNMGEQTFRRRFVCETGQQPKMFITAIQMDLAARLLLQDSSRPVGEVARECGFDEASAFSHAFKKAYACSPTQYRQGASPA